MTFHNASLSLSLTPVGSGVFSAATYPNKGADSFISPNSDEGRIVMVESPQSVANILENQLWDAGTHTPVDAISSLPYIEMVDSETGSYALSSRDTPHRVASGHFVQALGGQKKAQALLADVPPRVLAAALDPVSLLFGFWFSQWVKGETSQDSRLARSVIGRIAARNAEQVHRGGVQFDTNFADASGDDKASSIGTGMIPFSDTNADLFVARTVTFHLDLRASRLRDMATIPVIGQQVAELSEALFWFTTASIIDQGELDLRTEAVFDITSDGQVPPLADATSRLASTIDAYNTARPDLLAQYPALTDMFSDHETSNSAGTGVIYRLSNKVSKGGKKNTEDNPAETAAKADR